MYKSCVQLIIIPNNEYGKYCPGAAARPEYGSVFRVSLPITGLLSSWSLDKIMYDVWLMHQSTTRYFYLATV